MRRNFQSVARAGVTEDFVGMRLQGSALEVPNPGTSRTAPLQRRSLVLSDAAETGNHLLEPSWEMIAYAASQDQAGESSGESSSGKGANKRLHAELSPLPEEVLDGAGMDGLSSGGPSTSSKGRAMSPSADENNDRPRRSTRPRNKVARRD
jgi:ser/thr/tyr protein kinase RAD53